MELGKVAEVLFARGFAVSVFSASAEAAAYLNREINHTSVGFGGSMSVEAMGLYESLGSHNELYSHWHVPEGMSVAQIHEKAAQTKVYLCSANALAETGEIVNIDGHGNRLASTLFGHETVYFVIGRNKIVPTYEDALWRAQNIAAPKRAQSLHKKTPCALKGDRCYHCSSPERVCRGLAVLWYPVSGCKTEIVLIDEDLGM